LNSNLAVHANSENRSVELAELILAKQHTIPMTASRSGGLPNREAALSCQYALQRCFRLVDVCNSKQDMLPVPLLERLN